jgi:hypothetical protein
VKRTTHAPRSPRELEALAEELAYLVAALRARDDLRSRIPRPAPLNLPRERPEAPRVSAHERAARVAPVDPSPVAAESPAVERPRTTRRQAPAAAANGRRRYGRPRHSASPRRRIHLTSADRAFLRQLGRTGAASDRHANDCAGIRPYRLRQLIAAGYVQVRSRMLWERGDVRYYGLGPAGRRVLRRERFGALYHHHPAQLLHDLKLTDVYYRLPEVVRRTWVPEGQIRAALEARGHFIRGRCVDAAVRINGQAYAIEALTPNYKRSQIALKHEAIAEFFGGRALVV